MKPDIGDSGDSALWIRETEAIVSFGPPVEQLAGVQGR